jgi:hypothetical protein
VPAAPLATTPSSGDVDGDAATSLRASGCSGVDDGDVVGVASGANVAIDGRTTKTKMESARAMSCSTESSELTLV